MAVTRWLIDKSALARSARPEVARVLVPRIDRGLIGIALVTELETGFSARSTADHDAVLALIARLIPIVMPVRAEQIARQTQRRLVERGQHRAVAVPDLLVAATAQAADLTVLHYDADFDLISAATAQPVEWMVERGSVD